MTVGTEMGKEAGSFPNGVTINLSLVQIRITVQQAAQLQKEKRSVVLKSPAESLETSVDPL